MPGDPLKKVLPGQKLEVSAGAFNAFMDAARYVRAHQHDTAQDPGDEFRQTGIVKVRNSTDRVLPRYSVLSIQEPIVGPANLQEFKNKVSFNGIIPRDPTKCLKPIVLLDPLRRNAIGRGIINGVTPVRINVIRESDTGAELEDDVTDGFRSSPWGQTRILWKEPGLGMKWAVVRLGDRPRLAVFELTADWVASEAPTTSGESASAEPDGWAKMEDCKPVLYVRNNHTYRPDSAESTETVWHQVGYPPDQRQAVIDLHKQSGLLPARFGRGDWVWCLWNEYECRWQLLGQHEDHWRFTLLSGLTRCGSALAQLVLYRDGRWCPVDLTFTVHDAIGIVCSGLCKATGSSSGTCSCGDATTVPAGTYGVARRFADSRKWEALALGRGCCPGSSSSMSSSGSSSGSSSNSWVSSSSSGSSSGESSSSSSSSSAPGSSSGSSVPSSSGPSSGSGSSGPPGSSVTIQETDVRCEEGRLNVYVRMVTITLENGGLTRGEGAWVFHHPAGCCCCEGCSGSSSSSSSVGSSSSSSGSSSGSSSMSSSSLISSSDSSSSASGPQPHPDHSSRAAHVYQPCPCGWTFTGRGSGSRRPHERRGDQCVSAYRGG